MSKPTPVQISPGCVVAYARDRARPPIAGQADRLVADLAVFSALLRTGDPRARGAALAVAYGALRLAVTPARTDADRRRRDEALAAALLALGDAGLDHVGPLVQAALACGTDPASVARGVERLQ